MTEHPASISPCSNLPSTSDASHCDGQVWMLQCLGCFRPFCVSETNKQAMDRVDRARYPLESLTEGAPLEEPCLPFRVGYV